LTVEIVVLEHIFDSDSQ